MTKDHDIVEIREIKSLHGSEVIHIHGYKMKNKQDIFILPIKSSYLNMFKVEEEADDRDEILTTSSLYIFPLIHTFTVV